MATTQLSRTPSYNGSSLPSSRAGSLSRTRGILIETMQLVEPKKQIPVPDHLLDSKIYSKVAQNSVVQARPAIIHFAGFEINNLYRQSLRLANISGDVQRMHIIPPQTKYFYVKYTKNDRLVPGLTLDCVIEFTPDESRYYYDCIRIHTKGEENLIIPIHAYPVMNTKDFPDNVSFPPVPVGQKVTKSIPLRCQAPVDFEFEFTILQHHPAFTIDPLAGVIPANDEVEISVTFAPTEFSTATMQVQLVISQFNSKPLVCSFFGTSQPGLLKQLTMKDENVTEDGPLDPRSISPLDRSRYNKKQKQKKTSAQSVSSGGHSFLGKTEKEMEVAGIKFPSNLDNPHAVAQVLNQQPGKLRIKDLREAVIKKGSANGPPNRQMKEAMFEVAVRQDVYEERQNQLRWQTKLGDTQISQNARIQISKAREAAWNQYKEIVTDEDEILSMRVAIKRGDPSQDHEFRRKTNASTFRRSRRSATDVPAEIAQFDLYTNDVWAVRHAALWRFIQAARTIIVRARADKKILGLKQMMLDWGSNKYSTNVSVEQKAKESAEEDEAAMLDALPLTKEKVKSFTFPTYAPPNVKDDMPYDYCFNSFPDPEMYLAVDALGEVPYRATDVIVKKKTPYHSLKVPLQYELMGYRAHNTHDASRHYISTALPRPLRSGAEDEIITLHTPAPPAVDESDIRLKEMDPSSSASDQVELLTPPQALFAPIDYPPLHIFNPAPGLQVFQPPLPYSETDPDFHLCPLPRYTSQDKTNPHMATQKNYLDREDVIRGVMSWKKFPSQGLTSLANTPTLTNVWVPRWNDAFNTDLLPHDVPPLYDGLPEDEEVAMETAEEAEEDSFEDVNLTPEMVNAQFSMMQEQLSQASEQITGSKDVVKKEEAFPFGNKMPATNIPVGISGPVPREKREQELEFFMTKKYNRLGQRIRSKVENMDNLKTNSDLILQ